MRVLLIVALAGCAAKNVRDVVGMAPPAPGLRVAVAPAVTLHDLESPDDDMASFRASSWVGSIWFAGGYEVYPEEQNQVRSVDITLGDHAAFEAQGVAWATQALEAAAGQAGWQVVPFSGPSDGWIAAPTRRPIRGSVPFDGDDNLNLPRFDLVPGDLDAAAFSAADGVLVPILVHYYAHNAGWFIGQQEGTWAGARIRVLWSLHDAASGTLLGWGDVGTKAPTDARANPNRQQLQDALLQAEAEAHQRLARQLSGRVSR